MDLTIKTTKELLDLIYTNAPNKKAALEELYFRLVPATDPEVAWRGGIRPTHPNS